MQIRTLVPPESLTASVKDQITLLAPELSIMDIETMNQSLGGAFGFLVFRLAAIFAAAIGIIGLTLAVVGVYGVVSFAANQRTREIGIRLALGATTRDILHLVWKQGVRLVIIGVIVGLISAWSLDPVMAHMLGSISTNDPVTYITVGLNGRALRHAITPRAARCVWIQWSPCGTSRAGAGPAGFADGIFHFDASRQVDYLL